EPGPEAQGEPAAVPSPGPPRLPPALDELRRRWPEVVATAAQDPPTKPLIEAGLPVAVEGSVVTLGFPESRAFLRDAAERRRPKIEAALARVLGRAVSVRCIVTNVDVTPPVAIDPETARLLAEARRIFADDLVDVGEVS
ncbi:MAG TPA: hypothetical protein VNJ28_03375, partial [Candidatus Limnocylindrales bacterium]|nr:hypothetical protein [Candidatus Limnocylindrales bacterium]